MLYVRVQRKEESNESLCNEKRTKKIERLGTAKTERRRLHINPKRQQKERNPSSTLFAHESLSLMDIPRRGGTIEQILTIKSYAKYISELHGLVRWKVLIQVNVVLCNSYLLHGIKLCNVCVLQRNEVRKNEQTKFIQNTKQKRRLLP